MRSLWTAFLLSGALICLAAPIREIASRRYEIQVHFGGRAQYQDIGVDEAVDDLVYLFARGKKQKNKSIPLFTIRAGGATPAYLAGPKTPTTPTSPRLGHQSHPSSPNPALGGVHHPPAQAHHQPDPPFTATSRQAARSMFKKATQGGPPVSSEDLVHAWKHEGKTYHLTTGDPNRRVGYEHIVDRHGKDFQALGWTDRKLGHVMEKAMKTGTVVAHQNIEQHGAGRPIYRFQHEGQERHLAITTGANGQVIGANVLSKEDAEAHVSRNEAWHARQGQHNGGTGSTSGRAS